MFVQVRILLLVSMIILCLEVDHLGSTLIVDTSVGEIVLLGQVCCSYVLETDSRNLVDDSYYIYYIWYAIYGPGISCEFDDFDGWFGRRVSSFTPLGDCCCFCGSSFGSSDFVLHSMCGRSHSPCFGLFSHLLRVRLLVGSSLLLLWVFGRISGRLILL